jgi:large subunit ribosomal protein L19
MNETESLTKKMSFIKLVETKYARKILLPTFQPGDFIRLAYRISEGEKDRLQYYEGLVIAIQNRGLGKSFTIRRMVEGIGIEQIFFFHSPKIESLQKKASLKVRRAKLYYLRTKRGKVF